jgi:hypothetical protein
MSVQDSGLPHQAVWPVIAMHRRVGAFQLLYQHCRADHYHQDELPRGTRQELMPECRRLLAWRTCRAEVARCHQDGQTFGTREELTPKCTVLLKPNDAMLSGAAVLKIHHRQLWV